ncbi:YraN family protein [Corynebacterium sp. SCR221107]|nr:YraN family protein [Corynebacterium sp. SCR221107]WBT07926.1 YraN family protein [Corynebacterium sp. SCR221107]
MSTHHTTGTCRQQTSSPSPRGRGSKCAPTGRQQLGGLGEDHAAAYLKSNGYRILERNVAFKEGEIDIIAQSGDGEICFVEVKTRRGKAFGVEESVSTRKLRRLRLAAARWLEPKPWLQVRFDVIGVVIAEGMAPHIRHVKGVDRGSC